MTLEAAFLLHAPTPAPGVVVCHPRPQYGGDMENNVVLAACRALAERGCAALRFNFRGIGRSEGDFDPGQDAQADARAALAQAGLDGLLLFKSEDMYWLCGLDTDGFVIFNNMFIGVDGQLTHVVRAADLANVGYSSICDDVRISPDNADTPRSKAVRDSRGILKR